MADKIIFTEINYHCHSELTNPREVIQKHLPSNLFAHELLKYGKVDLVKHANYTGSFHSDGIGYYFFKRKNKSLQIPFIAHSLVIKLRPDLVLVQGFVFPLQVIALRQKLGTHPIILLQHHGESPSGKKKFFQKRADKYVDGYLFSAAGNSNEWLSAGVIRSADKCFELPSASTSFTRQDKEESRKKTGMQNGTNFLWVGRLNANKDPMTVLKAFDKYCSVVPGNYLSMIFSPDDLLGNVSNFIERSKHLAQHVRLICEVPHAELQNWFSAADYFISASWKEGGSYALTEAMACGCIPLVTKIPSSMKAIDDGNAGFYFKPGDSDELAALLQNLSKTDVESFSGKVLSHFQKHLSPEAVAKQLYSIYIKLQSK